MHAHIAQTYSLYYQVEGSHPELIAQYTDRENALDALRDLTLDDLGDLGRDEVIASGNASYEFGCGFFYVEDDLIAIAENTP